MRGCRRGWARWLASVALLLVLGLFTVSLRVLLFLPSEFSQKFFPLEEADSLEIISRLRGDVVLYNRVPKTGSLYLCSLIGGGLATRNNFSYRYSTVYNRRQLNLTEQVLLMKELQNLKPPAFYHRHVYFTDFAALGLPWAPVHINMIRDPIEKKISRFHFWRTPGLPVYQELKDAGRVNISKPEWLRKDFSECVKSGNEECSFITGRSYDLSIPYFCGHDPECMILNSEVALSRAKRHVESHYAVVGVLEELPLSLQVLEWTLPQFFRGIVQLQKRRKGRVNKTANKKPVPDHIKTLLKRNLTKEYEFYEFVLQRLHAQYSSLKSQHSPVNT